MASLAASINAWNPTYIYTENWLLNKGKGKSGKIGL